MTDILLSGCKRHAQKSYGYCQYRLFQHSFPFASRTALLKTNCFGLVNGGYAAQLRNNRFRSPAIDLNERNGLERQARFGSETSAAQRKIRNVDVVFPQNRADFSNHAWTVLVTPGD